MQHLTKLLGTAPDGREIFRYRITDEGYRYARDQLRKLLAHKKLRDISDESAAFFCVFGAEWWRREHERGPWSWDGIKRGLGVPSAPYSEIVQTVLRGLAVLGRSVLEGEYSRQYLVTLACEGGLPLRRLEVAGASLRLLFRDLLEHFEATGIVGDEDPKELARIARLFERRVPPTLQHDVVFRLVGELVGRAWYLRRGIGTEAKDPVRRLDETTPGWRETLPLLLTDRTAEALLQGLMTDVARVARGQAGRLRFVTQLSLTDAEESPAVLYRALTAPPLLSEEALVALFGASPESQRLYLRMRNERGDTLRVGTLNPAGEEMWSWEPARGAVLSGSGAVEQLVLEAVSRRGQPLESGRVEGSGRLGPLPWVFRPVEGRTWELVGIGSISRRDPELLVAIPPEAHIDGDAVHVGEVVGRALYRVSGETHVALEADSVRIRTGQPANSTQGFELRGRMFSGMSVQGRVLWHGLPRLCAHQGLNTIEAALEVRDGGGWRRAKADDNGILDVRGFYGEELVFRERLRVVPADLEVRLDVGEGDRPGLVEFESQHLLDAGVPADAAWNTARTISLPRVSVRVSPTGRTPSRLPIRLTFGGTNIDGSVPFPFRGMHFEGPDGGALAPGAVLHIDHLGSVRAVGLAPTGRASFAITLVAERREGHRLVERTFPLVERNSGEHTLALRDLEPELLDLLGSTEHLDGRIRVSLWSVGVQTGGGGAAVDVVIQRYDWRLIPDHTHGDVALEGAVGNSVEGVVVEARPFADITRVETLPRLRSPRFPEPRWTFNPEQRSGPWLITCREGGWYRCRPVAFAGRQPLEHEPAGLEAISMLRSETERMAALERHFDWNHLDWPRVEAHARLLGDLPAATFDVIRVLVRKPDAVAALAVRCAHLSPTELVAIIDGLEELVFSWSLVPVDAWERALGTQYDSLAQLAQEHALGELEARARALGRFVFPTLVAFYRWAQRRGLAHTLSFPNEVSACTNPELTEEILASRAPYRVGLLQRHVDELWPNAPHTHPSVGPRWSLGGGDLPEHQSAVLDAPVLAALVVTGRTSLDLPSTLFIKTARAFDEGYFDPCFRSSLSAILASQENP